MWLCHIALFAWQTQPNERPIQYSQQHLVFLQPQYAPLHTTTNEAAATKLWTVYVSEAEKYDKALLESWKKFRSDWTGRPVSSLLCLTAFLIESYKLLIPDSGDATGLLLAQISQQWQQLPMAPHSLPLHPLSSLPVVSLLCNAIWFLSLSLSLSCALITTLLEQWACDFLHKANMRSAPVICARIFSYLYYGMKHFNMHIVVEIIPLLLHTSLIFFAGLVTFLVPINTAIMSITAALTFWALFQNLKTVWPCCSSSPAIKSLANEIELELFIEGISDALWGQMAETLFYSCDSGLLSAEAQTQHKTICSQVLWAITSLWNPVNSPKGGSLEFKRLLWYLKAGFTQIHHQRSSATNNYHISTITLMQWAIFCTGNDHSIGMLEYLSQSEAAVVNGQTPDMLPIRSYIADLEWILMQTFLPEYDASDPQSILLWIKTAETKIRNSCAHYSYKFVFNYLHHSAQTWAIISLEEPQISAILMWHLISTINDIMTEHLEALNAYTDIHWINEALFKLICFWKPNSIASEAHSII
ncbi:hypothetical protein B0H10DRAFT_1970095 [Mycena sp. CBHHK59/15]|nr:hypothetical protein B0H10DRAFT_1970095 [Mycena sp. CBHHK59/15]